MTQAPATRPVPPQDLASRIGATVLAYRGYNVANLGRTGELLACSAYAPIVQRRLREAAELCGEATGAPVDLVARVREGCEAGLDRYAEAIALVFAVELAHLDLLRDIHGVEPRSARFAMGYSLGELAAVAAGGVFAPEAVLMVPLAMARDCAELAAGCAMGVVFTRGRAIDAHAVARLCEEITADGAGTIGVSSILSPNTLLVLGQGRGPGGALDRLEARLKSIATTPVHVRRNDSLWPPLHTPIVRQRFVPDRASVLVERFPRLAPASTPPIFSLVTGKREYADDGARGVLRRWVDEPQRLWDGVVAVLSSDVRRVVHVGPAPNLIPATFRRLSDNVRQQAARWTWAGVGLAAAGRLVNRPWLASLLPQQGSLLRAPLVEHLILEDWLLEHAPGGRGR